MKFIARSLNSRKLQDAVTANVRRAVIAVAAITVAVGLAGVGHATVLCVSASGTVPARRAKKLGCSASVYQKIGDAVGAASAGDTVFVLKGTYDEMVYIPSGLSGLTLMGQNPKNTIINATGAQNGILDEAVNVTIDGFTVEDAAHEGILVEGEPAICGGSPLACNPSGDEITGVTIADNIVQNNDQAIDTSTSPPTCPATGSVRAAPDFDQQDCGEGVHLDGVAFSTVSNNRVVGNQGGILLTDETQGNQNNLVSYNIVEDNPSDCGITLPSHPPNGSSANVGVQSFGVFDNTIAGNLSQNNGDFGVGVFAPTPGTASYHQLIVGNRLIDNGAPGVGFHSHAVGQELNESQVIGNVIQGNGSDLDPGPGETNGPGKPTGIEVYADLAAAPITGIKILGNTIKKEHNGIWVGAYNWQNCTGLGEPCYVVDAHLNNFVPGLVGVNNAGVGADILVQGTNNFWGCAKGPNAVPCATTIGDVMDVPFLTKHSTVH